jgi:hypothetical protein
MDRRCFLSQGDRTGVGDASTDEFGPGRTPWEPIDVPGNRSEPERTGDERRARDALGDAASAVFDDLASGDLDELERRSSPYQHRRLTRVLIRAAGRDPHCTPRSETGCAPPYPSVFSSPEHGR